MSADEEMSDGDFYKALRDVTKNEKRARLKASTDELVRLGIDFVSKNDGVHLIISNRWDFWPSTGKWFDRVRMKRGHNLETLLTSINALKANP